MNILCKVITDILHIVGILIVCRCYLKLEEKIEDEYRYIKIFIVSIVSALIINAIENKTVALIMYLLCIEIIVQICYFGDYKKLFVCAIWVSFIVEIIDELSFLAINTICVVAKYYNIILEELIAVLLSMIIIYLVSILLARITYEGVKNVSLRYLILFTLILFSDLMMLLLMVNVTLEEIAYKNEVMYIIAYIFAVIGTFIQLAAVILLLVSRNIHKEKQRIVEQYLEEQVKHYEYLNEKEKETKKFRHDIRGHLYFLNKLKNEGKDKEFNLYFQEIIDKVDDLGNSVNVGNDIVNAVLSKTYADTLDKNIKMNVTGRFPAECNISAYNLCTIFLNLLSNAIEAADKAIKREIWVICQYTQKQIIIEVGNFYCDKNKLDKNQLGTTKEEKEYHGWGLKNVEDSVLDCKGLMDIEIKNDKFVVSLTLNNENRG